MPPTATQSRELTRTQLLIQERLGDERSLASLVAEEREAGKSWAAIALSIHDATRVSVTAQSLRNWYGADDAGRRSAAA